MNNPITYIGISVSVASFIFGIWQYLQKRRIKRLISFEAVELHNNVAVALGATEGAKAAITNGTSPAFEVGRAEGLAQAILYESAKLYCNLKNTTIADIDDLIKNRQLLEQYREIYYSFSSNRLGFIRVVIKYLRKIY